MCFRSKLIIVITNSIAIITHSKNKTLLSRWTIKADNILEIQKLQQYVNQNKHCVVYIVINHSEQLFQHHSLHIPFTSNKSSSLQSLLTKDIKEKYNLFDLKTTNKNEQQYLIMAAQVSTEWLNFANEIASQFNGFALSPIEYYQVINILSLGLPHDIRHDTWNILFLQNSHEQIQAVIYYNNAFYKTEFIDLLINENITIYTGYIKQGIDNVINGLQINTHQNVNVYIIVSERVKSKLLAHSFQQKNLIIISPHEASIMLGLDWIMIQDEPCNLIAAYNILVRKKANHILNTQKLKKRKSVNVVNKWLNVIFVLCLTITLTHPLYINYNLHLQYKSHKELVAMSNAIQSEIDHLLTYNVMDQENRSLQAKYAIQVGPNDGSLELLKYTLSFHKKNRDMIVKVNYRNDNHNASNNTPPLIKIGVKNKKQFNKQNSLSKKQFDKLYVEMQYE